MRLAVLSTLLLLGCGLRGRLALAQQGPVEPLPPLKSVLVPAPALAARVAKASALRPAAPAPSASSAAPPRRMSEPLYILNQRIVVGNYFLQTFSPNNIQRLQVYKGASAPEPLRGLTENGIIDITLKKRMRLPAQSLAQLARQLRVRQNVSYLLNGMPLANNKLRIATESIQEIKIVRSTTSTTLSVWLFQRDGPPPVSTNTYPPGTIMIRGTASR